MRFTALVWVLWLGSSMLGAGLLEAGYFPRETVERYEKSSASVVGTGTTNDEAYDDAKSQLPSGKSHYKVEYGPASGGKRKCTLHYYTS